MGDEDGIATPKNSRPSGIWSAAEDLSSEREEGFEGM